MTGGSSGPIGILGAGAVATALARRLALERLELVLWARDGAAAKRLVRATRSKAKSRVTGGDLASFTRVETAVLAVRDDAIEEVAVRLAAAAPRRGRKPVALHTSGYHDVEPLAPLAAAGWATGGLHPLVSLAGGARDVDAFRDAWFATCGGPKARRRAREIVERLGGHELALSGGAAGKRRYHAAAALLAGGSVALFDASLRALEGSTEREDDARAALAALLASVLGNLEERGTSGSLTGPVARGDAGVLRGHLDSLRREDAEMYRVLARRMLRLARRGALSATKAREIARLLDSDR